GLEAAAIELAGGPRVAAVVHRAVIVEAALAWPKILAFAHLLDLSRRNIRKSPARGAALT
ncbi:MAG: hypothetical protein KGI57_08170, partial [Hyphomicrobiales bacterium]|nr:hypothetical protein [Hyphomicrobiales bacterium]